MKSVFFIFVFLFGGLIFWSCESTPSQTENPLFHSGKVYESKHLLITQISPHCFVHTSFLQTTDFGKVPCNGLVVLNQKHAAIFDTPTNDSASTELILWLEDSLNTHIRAIVPTHFHHDCLGGLNAFHLKKIPSYALAKTIDLAKKNNYSVPQIAFSDSTQFDLNGETIFVKFFGEGHTCDNIVAYFPKEQVLFGGCLIKELQANKGYLGDANEAEWSATVTKVKRAYPHLKLVVPGHGAYGDSKLLDYTIHLFKKN